MFLWRVCQFGRKVSNADITEDYQQGNKVSKDFTYLVLPFAFRYFIEVFIYHTCAHSSCATDYICESRL